MKIAKEEIKLFLFEDHDLAIQILMKTDKDRWNQKIKIDRIYRI